MGRNEKVDFTNFFSLGYQRTGEEKEAFRCGQRRQETTAATATATDAPSPAPSSWSRRATLQKEGEREGQIWFQVWDAPARVLRRGKAGQVHEQVSKEDKTIECAMDCDEKV